MWLSCCLVGFGFGCLVGMLVGALALPGPWDVGLPLGFGYIFSILVREVLWRLLPPSFAKFITVVVVVLGLCPVANKSLLQQTKHAG